MISRRKLLFGGFSALVSLYLSESQAKAIFPKFVWDDIYSFGWVDSSLEEIAKAHPFPLKKYDRLCKKLLESGVLSGKDFVKAGRVSEEDILTVHDPKYLNRIRHLAYSGRGLFNGENPINKDILNFFMISCAGTYQACKIALDKGKGMNLSGGFHHAFPAHEEGFCYINDVGIAIRKLQRNREVRKVIVVDCDVHHGNGNAAIFVNDESVFTFDIYQEDNYPLRKIRTDRAISLFSDENIDDKRYLKELRQLRKSLDEFKPDLMVYLAGADPFKDDQLGGFKLTHRGLRQRDRFVLREAGKREIPIAVVLAGGYARNIEDTVKVHYNTAREVKR